MDNNIQSSGMDATPGSGVNQNSTPSSTPSYGNTPVSTTTNTDRMITGMFKDRESAEKAYSNLRTRGYNDEDVDVIMSDDTRKKHFGDHDTELGNKALEGAGAGSAIGGTLGAIVGAVAAIGTNLLLPGLGLIIAGPLAAGLAGAGAGALSGGLIGSLVGHGIPEDRAKIYEEGVKNGHIVMGLRPRNDEDATYLENDWKSTGGDQVYR